MHLTRRFFASVFARSPSPEEVAWVANVLERGELEVWRHQPRYDRRHSLGVARRVDETLGPESEPRWLAAALMHDVGKVRCGLGIMGRVAATLVMGVVGRARVRSWSGRAGLRGRFGRYADHGAIGGAMIRAAGGRDEVARWAEVHHRLRRDDPSAGLDLSDSVVFALRDCDRD